MNIRIKLANGNTVEHDGSFAVSEVGVLQLFVMFSGPTTFPRLVAAYSPGQWNAVESWPGPQQSAPDRILSPLVADERARCLTLAERLLPSGVPRESLREAIANGRAAL